MRAVASGGAEHNFVVRGMAAINAFRVLIGDCPLVAQFDLISAVQGGIGDARLVITNPIALRKEPGRSDHLPVAAGVDGLVIICDGGRQRKPGT